MKGNSGKGAARSAKSSFKISPIFLFMTVCVFAFYLGKLYCAEKEIFSGNSQIVKSNNDAIVFVAPLRIEPVEFQECGMEYQDYTPCTDPNRWKKYGRYRLTFMERHCPGIGERKACLVPPPDGYKIPIRWPESRKQCWYRNVPYDWINKEKSNQHWLNKVGEMFIFPGGGTMFPNGVAEYVDLMTDLIPGMKDGSVRTAIDTGCGVASWGGDLLDRGILTASLAPRDNHQAQVQFALERGIPAILGIISTNRLPFPANSFDMAHCSRCLIPWTEFGGIYLLEIHRILRPGGFWVMSGPPVNYENRWRGWNTTMAEQKSNLDDLNKLLNSMCFELYAQKDDIAVWKKASDNSCYDQLIKSVNYPETCNDGTDPDAAWYEPLRRCISIPNPKYKKISLDSTPKWPARLHVAPERVSIIPGGNTAAFNHDDIKWKIRLEHYKNLLPAMGGNNIRNVMDMNTMYGGFAAALIDDPVWVMNVVSSYDLQTLGVVYDRGLIGSIHDWCEAFSTYPRTYDLLHVDGLFTKESHRCEMKIMLLEMDRILRPSGFVIIRESYYFMDSIATLAKGMRWLCLKQDTEYNVEEEKLLICQKKLWYSKDSNSL